MDGQTLAEWLFALFVLYQLLFPPALVAVLGIIKLLTTKSKIKRAGNNYLKIESVKNSKLEKVMAVLLIISIILSALSVFRGEWLIPVMTVCFLLYFISQALIEKKYGGLPGIYENGIIEKDKAFIAWEDVNSYKITDNNLFVYYKKRPDDLEYKNIENIEEIRDFFRKKLP